MIDTFKPDGLVWEKLYESGTAEANVRVYNHKKNVNDNGDRYLVCIDTSQTMRISGFYREYNSLSENMDHVPYANGGVCFIVVGRWELDAIMDACGGFADAIFKKHNKDE